MPITIVNQLRQQQHPTLDISLIIAKICVGVPFLPLSVSVCGDVVCSEREMGSRY